MNACIYQAALWCEACGQAIKADLDAKGAEDSGDSDDYPQGPYPDGGGEADCPQHCNAGPDCLMVEVVGPRDQWTGAFLCNPLTEDGYRYVREAVAVGRANGTGYVAREVWAPFYLGDEEG